MDRLRGTLTAVSRFVHKHFLLLMLGSYVTAAFFPTLGLSIRDVSIGSIGPVMAKTKISLSMLMLACLLLNAGLGVKIGQLREMVRCPGILGLGMAANLVIPIAFIMIVSHAMRGWHNADEVQNILVGLALVASMPIAGSSTAWAQNADGSVALSLGLVLFSTLLSPLTTPVALHAVGLMASGDYAEDLHELASGVTGTFLATGVLAPSLLGICLRWAVGDTRITASRPALKLVNSAVLLLLNYSNACVSLPQAVADPDSDFLAATLGIVATLCVLAFAAGWLISWICGATPAQRISLMFGLGMNNNGTGLVLASMALADHPRVMLPIIFYNLVQHLAAGIADRIVCRTPNRQEPRQWLAHPIRRNVMRKCFTIGLASLMGLFALVVASRADEEKVPLDKVPKAVMNAVKLKFPKAKIEEASKEVENGKTIYEIGIEEDDHDITVSLKDDGTIVEIEKEIAEKDLPAAVTKTVKDKYPQGTFKKVEEVTVGEKVTFEIVVAQEGKKPREVVLDRSGKIVEDEEKKAGDD